MMAPHSQSLVSLWLFPVYAEFRGTWQTLMPVLCQSNPDCLLATPMEGMQILPPPVSTWGKQPKPFTKETLLRCYLKVETVRCCNGCMEQYRPHVVMCNRVLRVKRVNAKISRCDAMTVTLWIHGNSCRVVHYHQHVMFAAEEKRLTGL